MTTEVREDRANTGLYVTFAVTVLVTLLLGVFLLRPSGPSRRIVSITNREDPRANAMMLDEPIEIR